MPQPVNDEKRTTMTISILESDKALLQKYAIDMRKTSSALIHEWIRKFCVVENNQAGDDIDV